MVVLQKSFELFCIYTIIIYITAINILIYFYLPRGSSSRRPLLSVLKKSRIDAKVSSPFSQFYALKGLSHEIPVDFKNVVENGQILALIRAAAGF
jgi:hypothetical protein